MLSPGKPYPLGATPSPQGVNFALAAPKAEAVDLCIFDTTGKNEQQRLSLKNQIDGIWHGHLPSGKPGLVYGYRVHGPWNPQSGQRFNPAKLLLDPYAREIVGTYDGSDLFLSHDPANPAKRDTHDNAAVALKARVAPATTGHEPAGRARIASGDRVLYELHVKGQTKLHPAVPAALRGTYAGLAEPAVLDHLQRLGITTLSLMPVQHRADEPRLLRMGLSNYWGYNTIGWFAPEARYWSGRPGTTPAGEFRAMADAIHARGMELVIDVVYNHSAESDELGPTLSMRGIDNALYYHLRADDHALYENWAGTGNCLNLGEPRVLRLVMDSLRFWACEMGVDGFRFDLAPVLGRSDARHGFDPRAPFFATIAQDPVLSRTLLIAEPWDIGPGGYRLGEFPPGWLEWNDRYRDTQRGFWLRQDHDDKAKLGDFAHRFTASSSQFAHDGRAPTASVNFITAHDGFTLRDLVSYNERHNLANGEGNRDGHGHNMSNNCGVEGPSGDPAVLALRTRLQRALLATLMLSQGTPMLLAGDEIGHSQQGNNNAYCQDNETTWLAWIGTSAPGSEPALLSAFVARLAALRREAPALRSTRWWPAEPPQGTPPGIRWLRPDGESMTPSDWNGAGTALAILFGNDTDDDNNSGNAWLVMVNAGPQAVPFTLPAGAWSLRLSTDPGHDPGEAGQALGGTAQVPFSSIWIART
ncbi:MULTISPECIES: glycogen debranching protein GlgX [unclassified Variovorax]|jgi:glycogen operon protein|uniref:glycogen debranching protein GlgX n=1 Tax=unclassified Variovorax TaxID=663243 RepID=UPI000F7ED100|nr:MULTISPECIES: glycogen debranching protein GlgX [unclassified Variovorax]RSZ42575.1 glycogen debranching enzyme GlgX [Variovorax sp. 553]RSZ43550.1 glycogen debranching enzyme GlgX [Variovorax sp. 679]